MFKLYPNTGNIVENCIVVYFITVIIYITILYHHIAQPWFSLYTTKQITLNLFFCCFFPRFEMKKDIDTLIAEERAEIILKYDKVCQISL